jgi:hypothetical protein
MPAAALQTASPSAACGVAAHALVEARLSEVSALRDRPAPAGSPALPPRFLRHCDEQAVVGMHALLAALAALPEPRPPLDAHAVVAAPCHAGRLITSRALLTMREAGPATVSPHIVPQCSLHSIAGAVSVALGMHGPHLGAGGGIDALAEGLCAAVSLVDGSASGPPLVWLVTTEWDEEPVLDSAAAPTTDPLCRGLAVALEPAARTACGGNSGGHCRVAVEPQLSIVFHATGVGGPRVPVAPGSVSAFARALAMCQEGTALLSWSLPCPWGGEIRVQGRPAAASPGIRRREAA